MGLTQAGLAERLGVHERTVQRWELGEVDPSPMAVHRIREVHAEHRSKAAREGDDDGQDSARRVPGIMPSTRS